MRSLSELKEENNRDQALLTQLDKMIEWSEADVAAQRRGAAPNTQYSDAQVLGFAEQVYDRLGPRQEHFRRRMADIDREYFGDNPPQFDQPQSSANWYGQTAECLAAAAPECTHAQAQAAMRRFESAFANHPHREEILKPIRARLLGGQAQSQSQPG